MICVSNYSLLRHNTFQIDALCRQYLSFESVAEIQEAITNKVIVAPYLILGGGSNLLLTNDYPGTVLHVDIRGIEVKPDGNDVLLRCGAGEEWDQVVEFAVEHGYYGTENLSFIPGQVGASAVQNIGAYGAEVKDLIETVEAVEIATGRVVTFHNEDCQYAYRKSRFKTEWRNQYLITYVTYRLSQTFTPHLDYGNIKSALAEKGITTPTAKELRQTIIDIRKSKLPDPKIFGNAGSFFVNPVVSREKADELLKQYPTMPHYQIDAETVKIPAGWLIEQTGWKGRSEGRAGVHSLQALVLINLGGATGQEVLHLCERICSDVKNKFGIEIYPEVNIV